MKYQDDVRVRDTCAGPSVSLRPDSSMWCERKNSLVLVDLVMECGGQDYAVDPLVLTSLEMLPLGLWAFHSVSGFLTLPVSSFHACLSQTSSSNLCAPTACYIHIYTKQTYRKHFSDQRTANTLLKARKVTPLQILTETVVQTQLNVQ